jgi:hypothetical protein
MEPPTSSDSYRPGTPTDEDRQRWAALKEADTLEAGLFRQLHMLQGASRRWEARRNQGISDQNILDALEDEWGLGCGASGPSFRQTYGIGGANPRFWFDCTLHNPPTLQVKAPASRIPFRAYPRGRPQGVP